MATAAGAKFDEQYLYDLIDRLKHLDRGQLTAMKDAITNKTFAQCWQLDATGNWKNFRQDDDGDGTWDLNQQRTDNTVNEITDISETAGPSWVTPAYNRAGNMTTVPKPSDPTQSYTATYDAWNRLIRMEAGADKVTEYEYDGAKRRTLQKTYTAGVLSETRHLYYTEPSQWQVIEERTGTSPDSADAERQFVWGLRYIDDLVLRDRDTDANGSLDERLYALQDANWNVTAVTNTSGTVQERYAYSAYGVPIFLDATFGVRASSSFAWETLFAGYRWDAVTKHFQVRNRVYSPTVATWLQRDPIGYSSGFNLYEYVNSNPMKGRDPMGLFTLVEVLVVVVLGIIVIILLYQLGKACLKALGGIKGTACNSISPDGQHKLANAQALLGSCLSGYAGIGALLSAITDRINNANDIGSTSSSFYCDDEPCTDCSAVTLTSTKTVIRTNCTSVTAGDLAMQLLQELWRQQGKQGAAGGPLDAAAHNAEMQVLHNCLCAKAAQPLTKDNPHTTKPWGLEGGGSLPPCP